MSERKLTMASLFDGSGGFPLAACMSGIKPIWASEIEPFPIRVTTKRFPNMIHYGDVSKIDGAKVPPVDIITFGSPCQDLSVAGKRAGLEDGLRSNLFYQAVRIIKEMRKETHGKCPRWAIWENVPGAFTSNAGEDFKSVLESMINVKNEQQPISISRPNKWKDAGLVLGCDYSVGWRVLDAQYWGVPQRRKRIFLVADFAGGGAEKVLFESDGMSRYSAEGFRAWQRLANGVEDSIGEASEGIGFDGYNQCSTGTVSKGLTNKATDSDHVPIVFENHSQDTRYTGPLDIAPTVMSAYGTGGNNQPFVVETPKTLKIRAGCEGGGKGALVQENQSATLGCNNDQTLFVPFVKTARARTPEEISTFEQKEVANTLNTFDIGETRCNEMVVAIEGNGARPSHKGSGYSEDNVSFTLNATEQHAVAHPVFSTSKAQYHTLAEEDVANTLVATDYKDPPTVTEPIGFYPQMKAESMTLTDNVQPCLVNGTNPGFQNGVIETNYVVRRLTPTECARLQGFPDWWCKDLGTKNPTDADIKFWGEVWKTWNDINGSPKKTTNNLINWIKHPYSDASEYKMWGNGVALPCVYFLVEGIAWADTLPIEEVKPIEKAGQMSIFDF